MLVPVNPDLPASWEVPGAYFSLDLKGQAGGLGSVAKRLLVVGFRLAAGTQPYDTPIRVNGMDDANTYFGQGSDVARMIEAALSQVGGGVIDIYGLGTAEPAGGVQAARQIIVGGSPTSTGFVDIYVAGYHISVGIALTDTPTSIGANIATALGLIKDLPCTVAAVSGTVTATYNHKGAVGNDLPIRVDQTGAAGVTFSPGAITYASAATLSGSATVKVSSTTITTPVTNGDAAATIATNVAASINAGGYPVTASAASGVVTLFYQTGRVVNGITVALVSVTGTTVSLDAGYVAGTLGPTLTTALTNVAALGAFLGWVTSFNDTTSLGAISTSIETQGNGKYQKGQVVHFGSTDSLTVAGGIAPATTPALTASPRYNLDWCPESPQQAYELAARTAAMVVASQYAPQNYDGAPLKTDAKTPLLLPARAIRPSPDDQNSAIHSYYMTPLVVDESLGAMVVLSGKTTSSNQDATLHDWGTILHLDYMRAGFVAYLSSKFKGTNLRRNGTPHTPNTVTVNDIINAAIVYAKSLVGQDLYDDDDQLSAFKAGFTANPDPVVPTKVNCFIPLAVIRSLHQLGIVGAPV